MTCLLLCGCSSNAGKIDDQLDEIFASAAEQTDYLVNNYSKYADYYRPSDLNETESDELSISFAYNESSIVMNINVAGIIEDRYYSNTSSASFFDSDKKVYESSGRYMDVDGKSVAYDYAVYEYDDYYLSCLESGKVTIYSHCAKADIVPVSSRILLLAKGVSLDADKIITDYSAKETIDYQRKQVDLFETVLPVNGRVDELIISIDDTDTD